MVTKPKKTNPKTTSKKKPPIKKPQWTPEEVANALKKSSGLVATAARILGCYRSTIYEYIERYPEVKEAREEAREFLVDTAELGLAAKVKEQEAWAICFLLKTQGKDRGYSERHEVEQTTTHNMEPEMSDMLEKMFNNKK